MSSPLFLFLLSLSPFIARSALASLYIPPPQVLTYHHGPLLDGNIPVSVLWYGSFSPSQKSIINDFILSLTFRHQPSPLAGVDSAPSVSKWWQTVDDYLQKAGNRRKTHIYLSRQISDRDCSLGKSLTRSQLATLAATKFGNQKDGLVLILTAEDVTVESFCMSACGLHSSFGDRRAYVWVGNSARQCPGQCAWPFSRALYGPRGPPLAPPNGDVGIDGMVINLGTLLAGAVTNPFGDGFYEGEAGTPVEVAGACAGVYGPGAYPGYAGRVRVDEAGGGSYNAVGLRGRKYLVPAMVGPYTFTCSPVG